MILKGRIPLAENNLNDAITILGEVARKNPDKATARLYNSLTEQKIGNIEAWRVDYNEFPPHSSLGDRTPVDFARETAEKEARNAA